MKYLIMIHSNPASREQLAELSEKALVEFGRAHLALTDELAGSGELVVSEGLPDLTESRRVRLRDGVPITSDGPFAEVKEYLVGFYLVDCESLERAVEIAARVPDAAYTEVEVRPVLDFSEWDG